MGYEFLELNVEDGLGILTMNRPPGNGIAMELAEEVISMMEEVESDGCVRCLVIRSALPKYFMVGADLKAIPPDIDLSGIDFEQPPDKVFAETFKRITPHVSKLLARAQEMMNVVDRFPRPTIAQIGGHALGGGLELALACDLRFMSRGKATIGLTETTLGLIPAAGGTQRLPRTVGYAKAMEMILVGERLSADEAESIGLITKAVDEDTLEKEVMELATRLSRGATLSMEGAKKILQANREIGMEQGLAMERECLSGLWETEDTLEGITAFVQKRKPDYKAK